MPGGPLRHRAWKRFRSVEYGGYRWVGRATGGRSTGCTGLRRIPPGGRSRGAAPYSPASAASAQRWPVRRIALTAVVRPIARCRAVLSRGMAVSGSGCFHQPECHIMRDRPAHGTSSQARAHLQETVFSVIQSSPAPERSEPVEPLSAHEPDGQILRVGAIDRVCLDAHSG